jgi:KDO2-lipid IV(A) lauroyltransferase
MTLWDFLEYAGYRAGSGLLRSLSLERGQNLAGRLARFYFDRGGKQARYALANLRIAYPQLAEEERRQIARESYVSFAWNVVTLIHSHRWSDDEFRQRTDMMALETLLSVLERGRGMLFMTAHLGNFELGARAMGLAMPEKYRPLIMGRPMSNDLLYREVSRGRTASGAELIARRNVAPVVLRALRDGRPVLLLNDQYSRRARGVFVPLFGVRCSTSAGLATLALRTGAPVVPGYFLRTGRDTHRVVLLPEVKRPECEERSEWIVEMTARCNQMIERMIRAHPEQYMWGHRRFRYSPDLDHEIY